MKMHYDGEGTSANQDTEIIYETSKDVSYLTIYACMCIHGMSIIIILYIASC